MIEIWEDVKGFEGLYQVSNFGKVKSITRYKKILKPFIDKDGYRYVKLKCKGVVKHCRISRLVANAFVENTKKLNVVNHIDMNRQNDRFDNLEWCTQKENVQHSLKQGRYKGSNHKKVLQFKNGAFIKAWESMSEAARKLNIPVSNICKCVSGDRKTAGGYIWREQR